jgi:hypothetical protein
MHPYPKGRNHAGATDSAAYRNASTEPMALSIASVQRETGFGRTFVYTAIKSGNLIARKAGRRTVVLREDLASFLASLPKIGDQI